MARKKRLEAVPHRLVSGFYRVDPTTYAIVAGPFGSRDAAIYAAGSPPFLTLEVVCGTGETVCWGG